MTMKFMNGPIPLKMPFESQSGLFPEAIASGKCHCDSQIFRMGNNEQAAP